MFRNELNPNPILTNIAKSWKNGNFIADIVLPRVPVDEPTGSYMIWDAARSGARVDSAERAGYSRANRVDYNGSVATYGPLTEQSLEKPITKEELQVHDLDTAKELGVSFLMKKLAVAREVRAAALLTSTSVITNNVTKSGTGQWSDADDSTPINDIQTAVNSVKDQGFGFDKIVVVMSESVRQALMVNDQILGRLGVNVDKSPPSLSQLAALFGVDEVIVGDAMKNTAKEGQTATMSYIWGGDVVVMGMNNGTPNKTSTAVGYTLELRDEFSDGPVADDWYQQAEKTHFVRVTDFYDELLTAQEGAYLIKSAV